VRGDNLVRGLQACVSQTKNKTWKRSFVTKKS
jgi:hypothetical protein